MRRTPPPTRSSAPCGLAAALALSGCSAFGDDTEGTQVAAAFYPLAYVAERVGGDRVTVDNLTTPGSEPHDLELTIRETAEIAAGRPGRPRARPAARRRRRRRAERRRRGPRRRRRWSAWSRSTTTTTQPTTATTSGDGDLDPHFWLDPLKMADLGDAVADEPRRPSTPTTPTSSPPTPPRCAPTSRPSTARTPTGSPTASGTRSSSRTTPSATSDRYGLEVAPVAGLTPDAEPTPAALADLQQLIDDDGITTVFSERLASPRLTQTPGRRHGRRDRGARPHRGPDRPDHRRRLPDPHARQPHRPARRPTDVADRPRRPTGRCCATAPSPSAAARCCAAST